LRTFIAANLPQGILQKIDKINAYFKSQIPHNAVKWVDTQNLHLTIKFIGDLPEEKLPAAKSLIGKALKEFSPFLVDIKGLGVFPHADRPRVIWLGVEQGEQLGEIHNAFENELEEIGVKRENRDFHPHLTIGRVRRHVDRDVLDEIAKTFSQFKVGSLGKAEIKEIHLYQSKLTQQGPIYTSLFAVSLHQV